MNPNGIVNLPGYDRVRSYQIDRDNGCVPWGMEWLIRYKGLNSGVWEIPENQLTSFQNRYNLFVRTNRSVQNTFSSVLESIRNDYPNVGIIICSDYGKNQAQQKYERIEELTAQGIPCVTSIRLQERDRAHVVPVVQIQQDEISVIWEIPETGNIIPRPILKTSLYQMHNEGRGRDFIYLP